MGTFQRGANRALVAEEGLERPQETSKETMVSSQSDADSDAPHPTRIVHELLITDSTHPDLHRLATAWPRLSAEIRQSILALATIGLENRK